MSRLENTFRVAKRDKRAAFVPYVTAVLVRSSHEAMTFAIDSPPPARSPISTSATARAAGATATPGLPPGTRVLPRATA